MSWRVAESLEILREQLNEAAPNRSTVSDGSIGDTAHSNRTSDHNPWCGPGVVTARDFTHDPENGADMHEWAEALRKSRDPRIKYVIWNGRMFSSYATSTHAAFTWRPYTGVNLHTAHMHVSVNCDASKDSTKEWATPAGGDWFSMATKKELREVVQTVVRDELKRLAVGPDVDQWNAKQMNLKDVERRITAKVTT